MNSSDIRAREAYIVGKPPRILPLAPGEFGKEATEIVTALSSAVASSSSATEIPELIATLLRHPSLFGRFLDVSLQLFGGALSPRDRELAVLRTTWLCQSPYEWGEHVATAKRIAGVTEQEVERVIQGSAAPGWSDHERAVIRAAEELHADAMISDDTWAVLARSLNDKQLIELPILVGQYHGACYFENALRLRLIPGNPGLSAR